MERRSAPVDGFQLAYWREGAGPPVVLLHGWPGDHADYGRVVPLLAPRADVVVPDLRGFGLSDKHPADPAEQYSALAQARSVVALIDQLELNRPVLAGYDVGSRVAQAIARAFPERVRALVLGPPMPGAGERVLSAGAQREFWYQPFHRLALAIELIDGKPAAVRSYLRHFWSHWSGPRYSPPDSHIDRLAGLYSPPGAFAASIAWYRAGAGMLQVAVTETPPAPAARVAVPTTVLWPEHDPLFPPAWGDRVDQYFSRARVSGVPAVGHFLPVEAPEVFAAAIIAAI